MFILSAMNYTKMILSEAVIITIVLEKDALQKISIKPAPKKRWERPQKRWKLSSQHLLLPPGNMVSANGFAGVLSERW